MKGEIEMKIVRGFYNELSYRVEIDGKEVYRAGNSPYDSQVYTSKEQGVGLDKMKKFCKHTCRQFAKEKKAKFGGIEEEELS